jgi:hypothetical protein
MEPEGNVEDVRCSEKVEWKEVTSTSWLTCDRPS